MAECFTNVTAKWVSTNKTEKTGIVTSQYLAPYFGDGESQNRYRLRMPPTQVVEHSLHSLQLPHWPASLSAEQSETENNVNTNYDRFEGNNHFLVSCRGTVRTRDGKSWHTVHTYIGNGSSDRLIHVDETIFDVLFAE